MYHDQKKGEKSWATSAGQHVCTLLVKREQYIFCFCPVVYVEQKNDAFALFEENVNDQIEKKTNCWRN